jgi:hypothetical protein
MARALIQEADGRLHGLARFLERTGLDRDEELVRRLAARAGWQALRFVTLPPGWAKPRAAALNYRICRPGPGPVFRWVPSGGLVPCS